MNEITEKALPIIRATRKMTLPEFGSIKEIRSKDGKAWNHVTKIDIEVESYLKTELAKAFSDIGFVGEESGGNREAKKYWLVDPLDGTTDYIRGLPFCTTMLALVEGGEVTFSSIYDFLSDTMYHAVLGGGAFKNGESIHVSSRKPEESCYFSWESRFADKTSIDAYMRVHNEIGAPIKLMCAGYEFVLVASGVTEGRICLDPHGKDYDFAPGTLLVTEAGGVVRNIGNNTYNLRNRDFIAANLPLFERLTQGPNAIFPINN